MSECACVRCAKIIDDVTGIDMRMKSGNLRWVMLVTGGGGCASIQLNVGISRS